MAISKTMDPTFYEPIFCKFSSQGIEPPSLLPIAVFSEELREIAWCNGG
jgi:hypothetical protein